MSRHEASQSRIRHCLFAAPALGTNAAVLADTAMALGAVTEVTTFAGQPGVPRNVTVTGNAAAVTGNVVIAGFDADGVQITETIALNGTATVLGARAFAVITRITLPAYAAAATERVRVGLGARLGLPVRLSRNTVIAAFLANVREATAPTVAVSATTLSANTVTLNSALNGTDVIVDLYETQ